MPSSAYKTFQKNLCQVDRLLEAFNDLRPPTRGRKHLDHFTRAALIFLCSSWEVYIEQVSVETCGIISERIEKPGNLPINVQKTISKLIKNSKHDLEPIIYADDWRRYYSRQIQMHVDKLHTPKKGNVQEILDKYLGISGEIVNNQVPSLNKVNKVVEIRGQIAHNVFAEAYLKEHLVKEHYHIIKEVVVEIEICLWNYVPKITNGKRPWQNTYKA